MLVSRNRSGKSHLKRIMVENAKVLPRSAGFAALVGKWAESRHIVPVALLVLGITALRWWVAGHSDFETDEPYYWLWSRGLALGYFDHPPMIAYLIRLGTALFGDTVIGIRSMAIFAMLGSTLLLYVLSLTLFENPRVARLAVLWFAVTPHTAFFSIIMFPDTPAILFWVLSCVALALVWRSGRGEWWYLFGVSTGLLLASKYTGVFLIGGAGLWLLMSTEMRPWLKRYEPYVAGLIILVIFSPVILWNEQHAWVSFVKQFGRALDVSSQGGIANLGTFLGIQIAFVSPLIFIFIVAGLAISFWRGWRRQEANWLLLALTSAPVLLYFLVHALSAEVLPQWPSAVYSIGCVAAVAAFTMPIDPLSRRPFVRFSFYAAPCLALALTLVLYAQMTIKPLATVAAHDPLSRFSGWAKLSADVRAVADAQHADYIATNEQGLDGALAFYLRGMTVFQVSEAIRYVSLPPVDQSLLTRATGIYVALAPLDDMTEVRKHFDSVELVSTIWRARDGDPIEPYDIYRLKGYRGGLPF